MNYIACDNGNGKAVVTYAKGGNVLVINDVPYNAYEDSKELYFSFDVLDVLDRICADWENELKNGGKSTIEQYAA